MRWSLVLLVAACTERVQLGNNGLPGLLELEVSPASTSISFDALDAADQHVTYIAIGRFEDGSRRDVTELVDWTTDNPFPGTFATPGEYTATGDAAGRVGIHATSGEVGGAAQLTITMSATIVDSVFPPPDPSVFDGATVAEDPARTPLATYPAHESRFPQGVQPILFQHARGTGNDTVRLVIASDVLVLTVLTGGDRWQPDAAVWNAIARSHPNSFATLTIDGADSAVPGTLYRAPPIALHFGAAATTDLVYFFTSGTPGVVRGALDVAMTTTIAPSAMDPRHAVSRDGRTMALRTGDKLSTLDLELLAPVLPAGTPMGSVTFSPDGAFVLVSDKGTLTLRDAATGVPVGPDGGKVPLGAMRKGAHPSWAPDGTFVAFAMSDDISNDDVKRASIARISFTDGAWGAPEILVPSAGDLDNNFYPRVGPNDAIVYVHATSGSKDSRDAELRLLAGPAPVTLARASTRVGTIDVAGTTTTLPSWTVAGDGSVWLAMASSRPYGNVRTTTGGSQIWIAGLDLTSPGDPSFAAFWLPCQDVTALNNNPVFAPLPQTTR